MKIYLDSCITIDLVERRPVVEANIRDALILHRHKDVEFYWTDLTRMECRIFPLRMGNTVVLEAYDVFFSREDSVRIPFSEAIFERATQLRAKHGLKTPDALHLAAAIEGGCSEFWTNDTRLDKAASAYLVTRTF